MAQSRPQFSTLEEQLAADLQAYLKVVSLDAFKSIIEKAKKSDEKQENNSFWSLFSWGSAVEKNEEFEALAKGVNQGDILSQSVFVVQATEKKAPTFGEKFWGVLGYTAEPSEPVKKPKLIKDAMCDLLRSMDWTDASPNTRLLRELIKRATPAVDPAALNTESILKIRMILEQRFKNAKKSTHAAVLQMPGFEVYSERAKQENERREMIAAEGIWPKRPLSAAAPATESELERHAAAEKVRKEAEELCKNKSPAPSLEEEKHSGVDVKLEEARKLCKERELFVEPANLSDLPAIRLHEAQELCKNMVPELVSNETNTREMEERQAEVEVIRDSKQFAARLNALFGGQLPPRVEKSRQSANPPEAKDKPKVEQTSPRLRG